MRKSRNDGTIKVGFVIAGTQKGGTSALDAYMRDHPEICMADKKEVHFFDNESIFQEKKVDYAAYHSFFTPKTSHKLLGETTPSYMYWYDSPRRIWQYNPSMKVIMILRNPIDRAYSHWNMQRDRNVDNLSFREAIQSEPIRLRIALPYQHKQYSYIDRGFYSEQLRRMWTYFPKNQTLILKSEDLRTNPKETLEKVCNFLDLRYFDDVTIKDIHSRPYVSSMTHEEWEYLKFHFEYEVRNLERMLDWDCSDWLDPEFLLKT